MANVRLFTPQDMTNQFVFNGNVTQSNRNVIEIQSGDLTGRYTGSFSYDQYGNVYGTLDSYRFFLNGNEQYRATEIGADANEVYQEIQIYSDAEAATRIVLDDDDRFVGSTGDDIIYTADGNDRIFGGAGDDDIRGENGNDVISGGGGNDIINGGSGFDTVNYGSAPGDVFVSLNAGIGRGASGSDSLYGIESIRASGYSDVLVGDGGGNILMGLAGNDSLRGREGADIIDGGAGSDTADYSAADGRVFVHLGVGIARGADGPDDLRSIENAIGSNYGDQLVGSLSDNSLFGGNDSDFLNGRAGADEINGGDGKDFAAFNRADAGVFVHLGVGIARGGDGPDTLVSIEKALGSAFDDTIIGGSGDNTIRGRAGNDVIRGDGGQDFLFGEFGDDLFVFRDGHGHDIVADAEAGDSFDFTGISGFGSFSDIQAKASGDSYRTVIDTGGDSSVTLVGIGVSELSSDDFIV